MKSDGFRCLAYIEQGEAKLVSRKRNTFKSFPALTAAMAEVDVEDAILDGEIVALDEQGKPDFNSPIRKILRAWIKFSAQDTNVCWPHPKYSLDMVQCQQMKEKFLWQDLPFRIQEGTAGDWVRVVDTSLPGGDSFSDFGVAIEKLEYPIAALPLLSSSGISRAPASPRPFGD